MVGTQFSKETRVRDEDEEMKKFIETEMEQRRGKNLGMEYFNSSEKKLTSSNYMTPEEAALAELPAHLKATTGKKVSKYYIKLDFPRKGVSAHQTNPLVKKIHL
jgi:hypothetical protein